MNASHKQGIGIIKTLTVQVLESFSASLNKR